MDVLVGTKLAKGLDFDNVSLVGIMIILYQILEHLKKFSNDDTSCR
jgi:superfamily II DNA/RNA helicase